MKGATTKTSLWKGEVHYWCLWSSEEWVHSPWIKPSNRWKEAKTAFQISLWASKLLLSLLKICLWAGGPVLSETSKDLGISRGPFLKQLRQSWEMWKEINCCTGSAWYGEQIYSQILKLEALAILLIKISKLVDINTCVLFVLCTSVYLPERAVTQIPQAFKTFIRLEWHILIIIAY